MFFEEAGHAEGRCRCEVDDGDFARCHCERSKGNEHASNRLASVVRGRWRAFCANARVFAGSGWSRRGDEVSYFSTGALGKERVRASVAWHSANAQALSSCSQRGHGRRSVSGPVARDARKWTRRYGIGSGNTRGRGRIFRVAPTENLLRTSRRRDPLALRCQSFIATVSRREGGEFFRARRKSCGLRFALQVRAPLWQMVIEQKGTFHPACSSYVSEH